MSIVGANVNQQVPASSIRFCGPHATGFVTDEGSVKYPLPHVGSLTKLCLSLESEQPSSGDLTILVRVDGHNEETCIINAGTLPGVQSFNLATIVGECALLSLRFTNGAVEDSARIVGWSIAVTQS